MLELKSMNATVKGTFMDSRVITNWDKVKKVTLLTNDMKINIVNLDVMKLHSSYKCGSN